MTQFTEHDDPDLHWHHDIPDLDDPASSMQSPSKSAFNAAGDLNAFLPGRSDSSLPPFSVHGYYEMANPNLLPDNANKFNASVTLSPLTNEEWLESTKLFEDSGNAESSALATTDTPFFNGTSVGILGSDQPHNTAALTENDETNDLIALNEPTNTVELSTPATTDTPFGNKTMLELLYSDSPATVDRILASVNSDTPTDTADLNTPATSDTRANNGDINAAVNSTRNAETKPLTSMNKATGPTQSTKGRKLKRHVRQDYVIIVQDLIQNPGTPKTLFTSLDEAEKGVVRKPRKKPNPDHTLPETQEQKQAIVQKMYDFLNNYEGAEDNSGVIDYFRGGERYDATEDELLCWQLLEKTIERQTEGSLTGKLIEHTFAERIAGILVNLRFHKSVYKHLMSKQYIDQVVDDPVGAQERVRSNQRLNCKKGITIQAGKVAEGKVKPKEEKKPKEKNKPENEATANSNKAMTNLPTPTSSEPDTLPAPATPASSDQHRPSTGYRKISPRRSVDLDHNDPNMGSKSMPSQHAKHLSQHMQRPELGYTAANPYNDVTAYSLGQNQHYQIQGPGFNNHGAASNLFAHELLSQMQGSEFDWLDQNTAPFQFHRLPSQMQASGLNETIANQPNESMARPTAPYVHPQMPAFGLVQSPAYYINNQVAMPTAQIQYQQASGFGQRSAYNHIAQQSGQYPNQRQQGSGINQRAAVNPASTGQPLARRDGASNKRARPDSGFEDMGAQGKRRR